MPFSGSGRQWRNPGNSGANRARFRSPPHGRTEKKRKASHQIEHLLNLSLREHPSDRILAERHAQIAWNFATKFNARFSNSRALFCHFCKKLIVPGTEARYRLSRHRVGINITCLRCGSTYHKIFSKSK
jgi:RNase P subunit RPR2